jgi:hypothetical protein
VPRLALAAALAVGAGACGLDQSTTWHDAHPPNACGMHVEWGPQPEDDAAICEEADASGYPHDGAAIVWADWPDTLSGCMTAERVGGCYNELTQFVYLQPAQPIAGSRLAHELRHRWLDLTGQDMDADHRDPIWRDIDAAADAARNR